MSLAKLIYIDPEFPRVVFAYPGTTPKNPPVLVEAYISRSVIPHLRSWLQTRLGKIIHAPDVQINPIGSGLTKLHQRESVYYYPECHYTLNEKGQYVNAEGRMIGGLASLIIQKCRAFIDPDAVIFYESTQSTSRIVVNSYTYHAPDPELYISVNRLEDAIYILAKNGYTGVLESGNKFQQLFNEIAAVDSPVAWVSIYDTHKHLGPYSVLYAVTHKNTAYKIVSGAGDALEIEGGLEAPPIDARCLKQPAIEPSVFLTVETEVGVGGTLQVSKHLIPDKPAPPFTIHEPARNLLETLKWVPQASSLNARNP